MRAIWQGMSKLLFCILTLKILFWKLPLHLPWDNELTLWGRVTCICVGKLAIISSVNGLAPGRRPVIIWTNAGILSILTLGTNFSDNLSEMHAVLFKKMHLRTSAKWHPFCLGLNVLSLCYFSLGLHGLHNWLGLKYLLLSNPAIALLC